MNRPRGHAGGVPVDSPDAQEFIPTSKGDPREAAVCESVEFDEVEFTAPAVPRLVIRFSDGLSIHVESERA